MDDRGHVLTNHHVIAGARDVSLVLSDDRRVPATVIGSDAEDDIAVPRARSTDLPAAQLGVSEDLRIGQPVIAVGSPLGLKGTVTSESSPHSSAAPPLRRRARPTRPSTPATPGVRWSTSTDA